MCKGKSEDLVFCICILYRIVQFEKKKKIVNMGYARCVWAMGSRRKTGVISRRNADLPSRHPSHHQEQLFCCVAYLDICIFCVKYFHFVAIQSLIPPSEGAVLWYCWIFFHFDSLYLCTCVLLYVCIFILLYWPAIQPSIPPSEVVVLHQAPS